MGSVCCAAAKDRTITNTTITNRPAGEILQRNVRHSPSWSFRWENRRRVAGEETSINWLSVGNDQLGIKSGTTVETTYASGGVSPLDSFRSVTWQKSPVSEENSTALRLPSSGPSVSRNPNEMESTAASPTSSHASPSKLSPSAPSFSSLSISPLSSKSHAVPASLTPSRLPRHSPGHHLLRQVSESRIHAFRSPTLSISEEGSPFMLPGWSNDSMRSSNGGSSDNWSMPMFSELTTSRRERWSFDSESSGFIHEKINKTSGLSSGSPSFHLRTCGICAKLLSEKSSFGSQKIITTNELAVIAVLPCGHVYHADCLECMTPEVNKYDPACPICTFGEKQALKMSEKVLRAEMDLKARKRSRNRVADSDIDSDVYAFDRQKSSGPEGRGPKMSSSTSLKSSSGRPSLMRHFSFGSKRSKSLSESHSTRKRLFFWAKSNKV